MQRRRVVTWIGLLLLVGLGGALLRRSATETEEEEQGKLEARSFFSSTGRTRPSSIKETISISGIVTDSDGLAIASATVCAEVDRRDQTCATTESNGRYELTTLVPEWYMVDVGARGYQPDTRMEDLRDRRSRSDVDFVLSKGGAPITGRIQDRVGSPIEGALVTVQEVIDLIPRSGGGAPARSRVDGFYELWGPEGSVRIRAEADGYLPSTEIGVAPGTIDLRMTPESVLTGRVVEAETRRAVEGVEVSASVPQYGSAPLDWESTSFTDADGRFTLRRLPAGRYAPTVVSNGWIGGVREPVVVAFAETANDVVVEVERAFRVSGRFLTSGGTVACDSGSVSLKGESPELALYESVLPDGSFEFDVVRPGAYTVEGSCHGSIASPKPLRVDSDLADLEIETERQSLAVVRGLVVDDSGAPAKSVTVTVLSRDRSQVEGTGWTDSDGAFRLSVPWSGEAEIGVMSYPWESAFESSPIVRTLEVGKDAEPVHLVTARRGTIRGQAISTSGSPIANARIHIVHQNSGRELSAGKDGRFTASELHAGSYAFDVKDRFGNPLKFESGSGEVVVPAGTTVDVSLLVEDVDGWIEGRIVDATGAAVPDASVAAIKDSEDVRWNVVMSHARSELSNRDGSFRIDQLAPGFYTLFAERIGRGTGTLSSISTNRSVTIELSDDGTVSGLVQLADGRTPKEFRIELKGPTAPFGIYRFATFARTNGGFRIDHLTPGEYELNVEASEGTGRGQASIKPAQETRGVVIRIESRTSLRGKILELSSERPAAGVAIEVRSNDAIYFGRGRSEQDGSFELDGVPVGTIEIRAPAGLSNDYLNMYFGTTLELTPGDVNELPPIYVRRSPVREGDKWGRFGFTPQWPAAGEIVVTEVLPGMPAQRAGLRVGDVITHVDGIDVTGTSTNLFWLAIVSHDGQKSELRLRDGRVIRMTAVARE